MNTTKEMVCVTLFQFHKVRLKEYSEKKHIELPKQFQFHKVRLKDMKFNLAAMYAVGFQFHKVRLKGIADCKHFQSHGLFQFHKVRLKVVFQIVGILEIPNFNSTRFD